jgi:hypothetical protein
VLNFETDSSETSAEINQSIASRFRSQQSLLFCSMPETLLFLEVQQEDVKNFLVFTLSIIVDANYINYLSDLISV